MFFIMGITDGRKDFDFTQTIICNLCGKYGRYQVFMTYTVLSLFFIPCFKWNKHYYAKMNCCGAVCELSPESGQGIANGNITSLDESALHFSGNRSSGRRCPRCGYYTTEDFEFCPKCGSHMNPAPRFESES